MSKKDKVDIKEDNKDVQLFKEELWTRRTIAEVTILKRNKITDNLDILEEIKRNNTREHKVDQALKREDRLTWEQDGIVYIEEQIYIPNNKKLKKQILQKNHDPVDFSHPGQWPELKEDIKKYVQGCIKCQQNKI